MNGYDNDYYRCARAAGAMQSALATPVIQFTAPKTITSMTEAFAEHCADGGGDFLNYLRPWHMTDALETINDAANGNYTPEVALTQIREALGELIAIALVGHRQQLEADDLGPDA